MLKRSAIHLTLSVLIAALACHLLKPLPWTGQLRDASNDLLLRIEKRLRPPPSAIKDMTLVTIDNYTLKNMHQNWPYSKATFAKVVENLKKAGAKAIAFDFVFWGEANPAEDAALARIMAEERVVLPCLIDESGLVQFSNLAGDSTEFRSGLITKIRDGDGITRKNLLYILNEHDPQKGILSWEIQLLKTIRKIDGPAIIPKEGSVVSLSDDKGEQWSIPVDPATKTYPIHFRAQATDFRRIPFAYAYLDNFPTSQIKDKIVILGTLSPQFGDLHQTPIGWLPGIALNANAFLNLYAHDFLRNLPEHAEWMIILASVLLAGLVMMSPNCCLAIAWIALEIMAILGGTFLLLLKGYLWDFALAIGLVVLCPLIAQGICRCLSGKENIVSKE